MGGEHGREKRKQAASLEVRQYGDGFTLRVTVPDELGGRLRDLETLTGRTLTDEDRHRLILMAFSHCLGLLECDLLDRARDRFSEDGSREETAEYLSTVFGGQQP
jgi:hypothetical protein